MPLLSTHAAVGISLNLGMLQKARTHYYVAIMVEISMYGDCSCSPLLSSAGAAWQNVTSVVVKLCKNLLSTAVPRRFACLWQSIGQTAWQRLLPCLFCKQSQCTDHCTHFKTHMVKSFIHDSSWGHACINSIGCRSTHQPCWVSRERGGRYLSPTSHLDQPPCCCGAAANQAASKGSRGSPARGCGDA